MPFSKDFNPISEDLNFKNLLEGGHHTTQQGTTFHRLEPPSLKSCVHPSLLTTYLECKCKSDVGKKASDIHRHF